jgi:hypothetical protein
MSKNVYQTNFIDIFERSIENMTFSTIDKRLENVFKNYNIMENDDIKIQ